MRKKQFKLTRGIKFILLATFMLAIFNGCKKDKDASVDNPRSLESAKAWYEAKQQGVSSSISNSKGKTMALKFEPNWENVRVQTINETIVYDVPVNTNLQKLEGDETQYHLIIVNDGKGFNSKTISLKNLSENKRISSVDDLYLTAFSDNDLSKTKALNATVKVFDDHFKYDKTLLYTDNGKKEIVYNKERNQVNDAKARKSGKNEVSLVTITVCTSWYLVTREYDSAGNLTFYNEQYLGDTCEQHETEQIDYIDGQVVSGGPAEADCNTQAMDGSSTSDPLGSTSYATTDSTYVEHSWKFIKNAWGLYYYQSTEKGVWKKVGSGWQWAKFYHFHHGREGITLGTTVTVSDVKATPTMGTYAAGMNITCNFNSAMLCKGFPINVDYIISANSPVYIIPN